MGIVRGAVRVVTGTADATTAAAGAIGGAAINGVVGGIAGAVGGIRDGLSTGSHSTPVAALALATVGATGLVEWPVVLTLGGTALAVHELSRRFGGQEAKAPAASTSSSRGPDSATSATKASKAPPRDSVTPLRSRARK
jgi:hypothetical protein